ncbi:GNAT family N-acetyltransferase [Desulfofustis limnaeus]|jgi:predicted N-acetyltransferase YhbS|uniref:N-acetyltransferase n=1 Tax=Desulfofustis limnaeus TaxID=2740163 RepID=A0ABN6M533_9BACT|nr:N-acetyltransferase [Desulfofustis limnaeus]MDX9895282.1 N-acetyltransferase [Desulfofustis sp.]BDD86537.1 N-acetyltransferase [Desulfofustis limnaeus]
MHFSAYNESDKREIQALFTRTFSASEGPVEGELIGRLALDVMNETETKNIFGFVATENGHIVGCVFFTRLSFDSPIEAFLLAPVAVDTKYQGRGVGQKLIRFGIERLAELGVKLVFTYGNPIYYAKVGFKHVPEEVAKPPFELSQPEGWLGQPLVGDGIKPLPGRSRCVASFHDRRYW